MTNMAIPGDQTIGIPAYLKIPLVELAEALLHGTTQDILAWIASVPLQAAYGMNDGPRRWWNVLDKALCSYGMISTRADRCF